MFHSKSNYVNDKFMCSMHVAMREWWKYWDHCPASVECMGRHVLISILCCNYKWVSLHIRLQKQMVVYWQSPNYTIMCTLSAYIMQSIVTSHIIQPRCMHICKIHSLFRVGANVWQNAYASMQISRRLGWKLENWQIPTNCIPWESTPCAEFKNVCLHVIDQQMAELWATNV